MDLKRLHNKFKRAIIQKQNGRVLDVGSGQGGDLKKYIDNTYISKVLLLEPQIKNGPLGKELKRRYENLEEEEKSRILLTPEKIEDFHYSQTFDFINMFFCLNQIDIRKLASIFDRVLSEKGAICGIAMFEGEVEYSNDKDLFKIEKDGDYRILNIKNSYVGNIRELRYTFEDFRRSMSPRFVCTELGPIGPLQNLNPEEETLSRMYTYFRFERNLNREENDVCVEGYLESFTIPPKSYELEMELRYRTKITNIHNIRKMIMLKHQEDSSYQVYKIFKTDSYLRKYKSKASMKTLLFRKTEVGRGYEYNICVSYESEKADYPDIIFECERQIKRYVCDIGDIQVSVSTIEKQVELEVEFKRVEDLKLSKKILESIVIGSNIGFNAPILLPRDGDRIKEILSNYIKSPKIIGERKFLFCSRKLGIWTWGKEGNIDTVSEESGVDAILDVELLESGEILVLDMPIKEGSFLERLLEIKKLCFYMRKVYQVDINSKYFVEDSISDGWIFTSPGSYDSPIYKYKFQNTIDILVLKNGIVKDNDLLNIVPEGLIAGRIYEITTDGKIVKVRRDKLFPDSRETIKSIMSWVEFIENESSIARMIKDGEFTG